MTTPDLATGNARLTPAQCAALAASRTDGSDRVTLAAVHPGRPDLDALTQALMELVGRHHVLRTTVRYTDDGPVAMVGTRAVVPVELMAGPPSHPAGGFPPEHFDPASGPLVHVALSYYDDGRTLLMFQAHPVALDEQAARRALHELGLLYRYFSGDGPIPPAVRVSPREPCSATGRVPRRLPVVTREIAAAAAERGRLIASSHGLPVALLVLAAWIIADATTSAAGAVAVAASLSSPSLSEPLGPACDHILLRAGPRPAGDIVALAEHLHTATGAAPPDDGSSPVTFIFAEDRAGVGASPFEVVETGSVLAPSEVSLAVHSTPAGWLLRLAHRADPASGRAGHAALTRTAALLEDACATLIDEELL
jgi:hypothetical protein